MGEVLGMMSTSFFVSTKLLSISAKGSGGAWGDGTLVIFPKWDYEFNSVLGLCLGELV
jgi:hypothetical protein